MPKENFDFETRGQKILKWLIRLCIAVIVVSALGIVFMPVNTTWFIVVAAVAAFIIWIANAWKKHINAELEDMAEEQQHS